MEIQQQVAALERLLEAALERGYQLGSARKPASPTELRLLRGRARAFVADLLASYPPRSTAELDVPIRFMGLHVRTQNTLNEAGYTTVRMLLELTRRDASLNGGITGLGRAGLADVDAQLAKVGLRRHELLRDE